MANHHYNLYLPEQQMDSFRALQQQTGLSVAELMRRMFDHCLRQPVLNVLVPSMSGYLTTGGR